MSNLSDGERVSLSKDTVLYACDCANCKGTLFYCYSTVRRHRSIFGVNAQAGLRLIERLGVSFSTREASVAGGVCVWPVGFVCGSCISTCTCTYM